MEETKKQFTIQEVISDPNFRAYVRDEWNELRSKRVNRPAPQKGFRYKRDWFDQMRDLGYTNTEFFMDNIEKVWLHKSNLSSKIRGIVEYVCGRALQKTMELYKENNSKIEVL